MTMLGLQGMLLTSRGPTDAGSRYLAMSGMEAGTGIEPVYAELQSAA